MSDSFVIRSQSLLKERIVTKHKFRYHGLSCMPFGAPQCGASGMSQCVRVKAVHACGMCACIVTLGQTGPEKRSGWRTSSANGFLNIVLCVAGRLLLSGGCVLLLMTAGVIDVWGCMLDC